MIDKDTALNIAQAWIDEHYNNKPPNVLPKRLPNINLILFDIFHPFYRLQRLTDHIEALRFPGNRVVINDKYTREEDFGWIFHFQAQRFLTTRNKSWMLVGTGPLIVDRCDGSIHRMHSHPQIEVVIEKYKQERAVNC